ncbi:hypothetical protein PV328_007570 [Microctonus aethiopoides]|uniref:Nose resistant-to-fluoxetine protein N-terminal domain-containing protein n=1 Tax=Microctonus aethiopoides TaxID=144406 RepID=A0AA39C902_9HYME|nr:hypothetical protein PV328_007570 [Microctonus aethiopoides]
MALPIVGKWIVLTLLLILFYVSYGFRIRDVGQVASTDQHSACHHDASKCPDVDTTSSRVVSFSSRRNRVDLGGVGGIGRIKSSTAGHVRKVDVEFRESSQEDTKELNSFGYGKVKFKIDIDEQSLRDGENDDDDGDDEDVVIEDEQDFDRDVDDEDDESLDEDDDKIDEMMENVKETAGQDFKWNFRSGYKKVPSQGRNVDSLEEDHDDNDVLAKKDFIFKRRHEKKLLNSNLEDDKQVDNSDDEEIGNLLGNYEKSDDNLDVNAVKIDIAKRIERSDKNIDLSVSGKNGLPLRKLEKVRLADKDKVKSIEEVIVMRNIDEESQKIEEEEIAAMSNVEKVMPKDDLSTTLIEEIKSEEKVPVLQETNNKKEIKVEKFADNLTKEPVKNEEKKIKKKANVKSMEGKEKTKIQSVKKLKEKSKDSNINEVRTEEKGKSIASKKHSEASISLSKLNDEILRLPNFVPNFTAVANPVCQQHGKIFLRQLRGHKLWALQMLDSSAKIPSGLLRGNVNQLGDYDECLGISAHVKVDDKTIKVQGKYCLANVDIYAVLPEMKVPVNLIQSRNFLRATLHDTGHFVPKFTTINWALCLPAACSSTDAQIAVSSTLSYLNITSGLKFIVDVDPNMCYVHQRTRNYSKETIGVLYFYVMILCLVLVATLRDFLIVNEGKANYSERIIMSFSLRRTIKILMKPVQEDSNDINCIHGIRSLATIALYVGHKMIPIAGLPYANRITLTEVSNNPISSLLRVSIVYTDSFLILSGVLSAFNMSKESEIRGEIRWFCRIVARFIRLTPALLVIIFWYAYIMEHIGTGPQWNIMKENADLCKRNSWTNLLYIQNFFPFEEMCATHTHQLALDMQLSLLAPILVFFLQIKPTIGILMMFFLLQLSATLRYFATVNNNLSVVIFHGMTVKHLYKTANLTYAISIHRLTPYLFGIGLGVLMHRTGKNVKIYQIFVILGWIFALISGSWSIFSPWFMAKRDYVYDPEGSANYAVIGPVTWALSLCWIIYACFTDHAGIINKFLSSYWLIVFSRISYSVYLTQFAVFFYNLATTRYSSEFQAHRAIDLYEVLIVIIISTILTLFFDIPMQEVKCVLMECTDVSAIKATKSEVKLEDDDEDKKSTTPINQENFEYTIKKRNNTKEFMSKRDFYDDEPEMQSWRRTKDDNDTRNYERRRCKSAQRSYIDVDTSLHRETIPNRYSDDIYRGRRSLSRSGDGNLKQLSNREPSKDHNDEIKRERLGKFTRKTPVTLTSSGSDDDLLQRREKSPRRPIERPRVSDEEDWEQELRIRRRRFMERLASEVQNTDLEKRSVSESVNRSSAEGKIALLSGTTGCRGIDSWTVSHGSKISIVDGSSQEPSENEEDSSFIGNYEQTEKERQVINSPIASNFVEEDDDEYDEELTTPNKVRTTMMDMKQSLQEDEHDENLGHLSANDVTPVATGKLFKRASIVKSQASEEDPEYLLPERPKLVEQEQEHPFKKAWQMQKSRSEEDGPSAFIIRDVKVPQTDSNQVEKKSPSSPNIRVTSQTFQLVVEDVDLDTRQMKRDENEHNERSCDNIEENAHNFDDYKQAGHSDDESESSRVNCQHDNEDFNEPKGQRRQSETSESDHNAS